MQIGFTIWRQSIKCHLGTTCVCSSCMWGYAPAVILRLYMLYGEQPDAVLRNPLVCSQRGAGDQPDSPTSEVGLTWGGPLQLQQPASQEAQLSQSVAPPHANAEGSLPERGAGNSISTHRRPPRRGGNACTVGSLSSCMRAGNYNVM